jgi:hypothetical protein
MGRLPEAWIAPPEVREVRELTRYRHKLVHLRTSCKDQVHAVLAKLGVPVTCTDIFGKAGLAWLDQLGLPQPYAGKVTSLRQLTAELTAELPTSRSRCCDDGLNPPSTTRHRTRRAQWCSGVSPRLMLSGSSPADA